MLWGGETQAWCSYAINQAAHSVGSAKPQCNKTHTGYKTSQKYATALER